MLSAVLFRLINRELSKCHGFNLNLRLIRPQLQLCQRQTGGKYATITLSPKTPVSPFTCALLFIVYLTFLVPWKLAVDDPSHQRKVLFLRKAKKKKHTFSSTETKTEARQGSVSDKQWMWRMRPLLRVTFHSLLPLNRFLSEMFYS